MNLNETYNWYSQLIKPTWAPPAWLFGPVWTLLYVIIFVTLGIVLYKVRRKEYPVSVLTPFALNLIFNFAFTPIQFGLRNNLLGALDVLLVLGTLVWLLGSLWPHNRNLVYLNLPYLAWVTFATALQLTITFLNL